MKEYGSAILTSPRDGSERSVSRPSHFTPGETVHGTHCLGDWVGPTAGLDAMEKEETSFHHRKSNRDSSVA